MSDFSDRPFVAGSLIGLRAFAVDPLGRLHGPSFGGIFKPGENVAKCGGGGHYGALQASLSRTLNRLTYTMPRAVEFGVVSSVDPAAQAVALPKSTHAVAGKNCSCGYYAYFNGDNDYARPHRVTAVVEGYGTCTMGDKGFRAEKARVVALVLPRRRSALRRFVAGGNFNLGVALAGVPFGVYYAIHQRWPSVAIEVVVVLLNLAIYLLISKRGERPARSLDAELIRRNYPEVPTYPTVKAALAAWPLTPPEPDPLPSPDSDEFWTMPVPQ